MIEIQNLSFGYNRKKMLYENLSLSLEAGSIYGLLGKNGAGKSTLLCNMMGLLFPVSGKIEVVKHNPQKRQPSFLQNVYFIPEEVALPSISIHTYLELYAPFYPKFNENQFYEYLKEFEVSSDQKLNKMSFGQQKKAIIAFGLACNTQVLIMDEPTNGLDIPSKSQFRKLVAAALTEERLFIISTHQVRDLDNLIDQIIIIDESDVVLKASVSSITEKLCFKTVAQLDETVIYAEDSLKGKTVVAVNTLGEDSKLNMEHLFNAVITNPNRVKGIFN
jgi:ABC-2 type transport system ATP-binding protein